MQNRSFNYKKAFQIASISIMMNGFLRIWFCALFLLPFCAEAQLGNISSDEKKLGVLELTVPAMQTESSAFQVQQILKGYEEKILAANPDFNNMMVTVTYVPGNIIPEDIMQILFQSGYASFYKDEDGTVYEMKDEPHLRYRYQKNY